ncbi:MAG: PadR family transcriptional regulator [Caulobacteraceae bacterium]
MSEMREVGSHFMNGVPELLVLRCLRDREMYGYELVQEIRDRTDAVVTLGEGVLYPLLHALERKGSLQSRRKSVQGRSRVYYAITPKGVERLSGLSTTWTTLAAAIRQVMQGDVHAGAV